ncbi:transglutaminase [Salinisphaera sp. C84B14]|uniref:transglutaminase TgpA family protein n=1 Tax=Salinisphaera sp. C84B14 TaxID=1304155 RepID=UPI00333FC246
MNASTQTAAGEFSNAPDAGQRLRLVVCLSLVAIPHALHLPIWVLALAVPIMAWQFVGALREWPLPGRWLRFVLAAAAFGAVFAGFGRVNGQEAGVSLLVLLLALKLCEIRTHRDAMVFLSLTCFLLATQFLFSQSLAMALYLVVGSWVLIAAFVDVASAGTPRSTLGESAKLLAQALPVAVLLFVLFPRIPGPIWGLPSDAGAQARTGLSESMPPGSLTNLALDGGVALRVRFVDGPVPPAQRYWRGPVLWDFDGRTWSRNDADRRLPPARLAPGSGSRQAVDITLEPTRHDWLIALDVPLAADTASRLDAGATLTAKDDVNERMRYRTTSIVGGVLDPDLDARTRRRALLLPVEGNPQARALATRWHAEYREPAAIVDAALRRFRQQPYRYTLRPPATRDNASVDDFLFDTLAGFCEHYAGAFTFLMRAAGVPARVVTGYQGAERATVGDYWLVRNSDAHAWAEVWLAGRGWVRVDPTAAVAPGRIEAGVAASIDDRASLPYMARASGDAWYRVQMLWDGINAGWNRWFLAYGPQLQQRMLDLLGLGGGWGKPLLALTAGVVALLALVSVGIAWRGRRVTDTDAVVAAWRDVCARLTRIGYPRRGDEGARAYADRIAALRTDLADDLQSLAAQYTRLRYAPEHASQPADRAAFIAAARSFRPGKPGRQSRLARNP